LLRAFGTSSDRHGAGITLVMRNYRKAFAKKLPEVWPIFDEYLSGGHQMNGKKMTKLHPRANAPWSQSEDRKILEMHEEGKTLREIAAAVQRHQIAVRCRLRWLLPL
jgi:hypothetical protein